MSTSKCTHTHPHTIASWQKERDRETERQKERERERENTLFNFQIYCGKYLMENKQNKTERNRT